MNGLNYSTLKQKYKEANEEITKLEKENEKLRKENRRLKRDLIDVSYLVWLKLERKIERR